MRQLHMKFGRMIKFFLFSLIFYTSFAQDLLKGDLFYQKKFIIKSTIISVLTAPDKLNQINSLSKQ